MGKHKRAHLSDGWYDFLKTHAQITLPALGTFYFTLSQIWGLPAAEQVVGTIVALDALLGLLLGYSNAQYHASGEAYDGEINLKKDENGIVTAMDSQLYRIEDPHQIDQKETLVFRVNPEA